MESVAGGWLGTYAYAPGTRLAPCRFEATFSGVGPDGTFTGRILDDGRYGEADVRNGLQSGAAVEFVKVYRQRSRDLRPIRYAGTLNDDATLLTGTWHIPGTDATGTWEAHRLWWGDVAAEAEREAVETSPGL